METKDTDKVIKAIDQAYTDGIVDDYYTLANNITGTVPK